MSLPKSGLVLINKDAGITSQSAVTKLRRILGAKTAGHSGTLDPMATGLLLIAYGRATRVLEYIDKQEKTYRVSIKFGLETDSYDVTGKIVGTSSRIPDECEFVNVLPCFLGAQKQVPPMYSAIHHNGKRLYELARDGEKIDIPARDIVIQSMKYISADAENNTFIFDVQCSKGTYIRSLCHDIGVALHSCAVMSSLQRVSIGQYGIENSFTIAQIKEQMAAEDYSFIEHMDSVFSDLPKLHTNEAGELYVRNGAIVPACCFDEIMPNGRYRLYHNDSFIAVGLLQENCFATEKNFYEL